MAPLLHGKAFCRETKDPDRELMTNQSMDIQVHFAKVNFVEVTYKNMGEELLIRAEISQRQLCHQSPANVVDSSRNQGPPWSSLNSL